MVLHLWAGTNVFITRKHNAYSQLLSYVGSQSVLESTIKNIFQRGHHYQLHYPVIE